VWEVSVLLGVTLRHVNITTVEDETTMPSKMSGTKPAVMQPYIPEEITPISVLLIRIGVQ
jgi:hypothetical protein